MLSSILLNNRCYFAISKTALRVAIPVANLAVITSSVRLILPFTGPLVKSHIATVSSCRVISHVVYAYDDDRCCCQDYHRDGFYRLAC